MSASKFVLTIELNKKIHRIVVEARSETGARLSVLAEFKDATILNVTWVESLEQMKDYKI
jgi:hypothetical protein